MGIEKMTPVLFAALLLVAGASAAVTTDAVYYWDFRNLNFTEYFTNVTAVNDSVAKVAPFFNATVAQSGNLSFDSQLQFDPPVGEDYIKNWSYFGWNMYNSSYSGWKVLWASESVEVWDDNFDTEPTYGRSVSLQVFPSTGAIRLQCNQRFSNSYSTVVGVTSPGTWFHVGLLVNTTETGTGGSMELYIDNVSVKNFTSVFDSCGLSNKESFDGSYSALDTDKNITFGRLFEQAREVNSGNVTNVTEVLPKTGGFGPQVFYDSLKTAQDVSDHYNNSNYYDFITVEKKNVPPEKASSESPQNGTSVTNTFSLSWDTADADGDTVTSYIYRGNSPTNLSLYTSTTGESITGLTWDVQQWYWKVNTSDGTNTTEGDVWTFTINNTAPSQPQLVSPADNQVNVTVTPTLDWNASTDPDPGAIQYDVYLGTPTPSLVASNLTTTTYSPSILQNDTVYQWYIVAKDAQGASNQSATFNFTTLNSPPNEVEVGGAVSNGSTLVYPNEEGGGVWSPTNLFVGCSDPDAGETVTADIWWNPDGQGWVQAYDDLSCNPNFSPGLEGHTNYSVYVVLNDSIGQTTQGPTTWFTTANLHPYLDNLDPANASSNISNGQVLSWDGTDPENDTLVYDVYLGTTTDPPLNVSGLTQENYTPALQQNETYYWRVVARDGYSNAESLNWRLNGVNPYRTNTSDEIIFVTRDNFPPSTPFNETPTSGTVNTSKEVNVTWNATDSDNDTLYFDVYFGTSSNPPLVVSDQTAFTYDPGTLDGHTTYYWKIVADDNFTGTSTSPVWNFTTANTPHPGSSNPVPASGATGINTSPELNWGHSADPDGDGVTWYLYVGDNQTPSLEKADANPPYTNLSGLDTFTTYYWRVDADDGYDITTGTLWNFTTLNLPPNKPTNESPASNTTGVLKNATLAWNSSDPEGQALTYDVYFGTNQTPALVANNQSANTYDPGALDAHTTYYWYVVANDTQGATNQSSLWNFTTINSNPNVTLIAPNGTTEAITLILNWTGIDADGDELTYDVYFSDDATPSLVSANQSNTTYQPGMKDDIRLSPDELWYWKVVANDAFGGSNESVVFNVTTTTNGLPTMFSAVTNSSTDTQLFDDKDLYGYCEADDTKIFHWTLYKNGVEFDAGVTQQSPTSYSENNIFGVASDGMVYRAESGLYEAYIDVATLEVSGPGAITNTNVDTGVTDILRFKQVRGGNANKLFFGYIADGDLTVATCDLQASNCETKTIAENVADAAIDETVDGFLALVLWDDGGQYKINKTECNADFVCTMSVEDALASGTSKLDVDNGVYGYGKSGQTVFVGDTWTGSFGSTPSEVDVEKALQGGDDVVTYVTSGVGYLGVGGSNYQFAPVASDVALEALSTGKILIGYDNGTDYVAKVCEGNGANCGSPVVVNNASLDDVSVRESRVGDSKVYFTYTRAGGAYYAESAESLYYGTGKHEVVRLADTEMVVGDNWTLQCAAEDDRILSVFDAESTIGLGAPLSAMTKQVQDGANQAPNATNLSPASGTAEVAIPVTLEWNGTDPDADPLTFDVFIGTAPESISLVSDDQSAENYTPTVTGHTTYYWMVRANDTELTGNSSVWNFTTANRVPVFANESPANGSTDLAIPFNLTWDAADADGDALTFDVYLGTSPTPVQVSNDQAAELYVPSLNSSTTYYWRVVVNDTYNVTDSGVFNFTTKNQAPDVPSNPSPASGGTTGVVNPTLTWTAEDPDGDALQYDFYFGTTTSPPLNESNLTSASKQVTGLVNGETYYWQIVSKDDVNETAGLVWNFSVGQNYAPTKPVYDTDFSPADDETGVSISDVDFVWSRSTDQNDDTITYYFMFGTSSTPPFNTTVSQPGSGDPSVQNVGGLSLNTRYWWQVKASDGEFNNSGPIWSFVTRQNRTPTVSLTSPAKGATGVTSGPTLQWSRSDPDGDTLTSRIWIGTSSPPTGNGGSTTSSSKRVSLSKSQQYYWRVQVSDGWGNVVNSSIRSFTTRATSNPPSEPTVTNTDSNTGTIVFDESDDEDDDDVTYNVTINVTYENGTTEEVDYETNDTVVEVPEEFEQEDANVTVEVTAEDSSGETSTTSSTEYTVPADSPPEVETDADEAPVTPGDDIFVEVSDENGDDPGDLVAEFRDGDGDLVASVPFDQNDPVEVPDDLPENSSFVVTVTGDGSNLSSFNMTTSSIPATTSRIWGFQHASPISLFANFTFDNRTVVCQSQPVLAECSGGGQKDLMFHQIYDDNGTLVEERNCYELPSFTKSDEVSSSQVVDVAQCPTLLTAADFTGDDVPEYVSNGYVYDAVNDNYVKSFGSRTQFALAVDLDSDFFVDLLELTPFNVISRLSESLDPDCVVEEINSGSFTIVCEEDIPVTGGGSSSGSGSSGGGGGGSPSPENVCGDGVVGSFEQCDDGNTVNGDGCSQHCILEDSPVNCGDGTVDAGEECDDGNTYNNDGCSQLCTIEVCGDGILQSSEECEDGNTVSGDGCSAQCLLEEGAQDGDEQTECVYDLFRILSDGSIELYTSEHTDDCDSITFENVPPGDYIINRTVYEFLTGFSGVSTFNVTIPYFQTDIEDDACTIGSAGEFNYVDGLAAHGWTVDGVAPSTNGQTALFGYNSRAVWDLACQRETFQFDGSLRVLVKPDENYYARMVLMGRDKDDNRVPAVSLWVIRALDDVAGDPMMPNWLVETNRDFGEQGNLVVKSGNRFVSVGTIGGIESATGISGVVSTNAQFEVYDTNTVVIDGVEYELTFMSFEDSVVTILNNGEDQDVVEGGCDQFTGGVEICVNDILDDNDDGSDDPGEEVNFTLNVGAEVSQAYRDFRVTVDLDRQEYDVDLLVGDSAQRVFTGVLTNEVEEIVALGVESIKGQFEFDYVRTNGSEKFFTEKSTETKAEQAALEFLRECDPDATLLTENYYDSEESLSDVRYETVASYCSKLSSQGLTGSYCSIGDLQRAIRFNRDCYKEAFNYCVAQTYPRSGGFGGDPTRENRDGVYACSLQLQGVGAGGGILEGIVAGLKGVVMSNLWFIVIGFVVIAIIVAAVKRK